jgi:hypothetical protein
LSYYADHRQQVDQLIAATEKDAERMHGESRHRGVSSRLRLASRIK